MALETIAERQITGAFVTPTHVANQTRDFTLTLTSTEWESNAGVEVVVSLEQTLDNGATFEFVCGLRAMSGPLGAPPHNAMPMIAVGFPKRTAGNRRLRLTGSTSAAIRLGATVLSV